MPKPPLPILPKMATPPRRLTALGATGEVKADKKTKKPPKTNKDKAKEQLRAKLKLVKT